MWICHGGLGHTVSLRVYISYVHVPTTRYILLEGLSYAGPDNPVIAAKVVGKQF